MKPESSTLLKHLSLRISAASLILSMTLLPNNASAADTHENMVIDDRSSNDTTSNLGTKWRLVTDNVMGGLSEGQLTLDTYKEKACLRMRGDVTTENNGGFVQIALPLSEDIFDASDYTGIEIRVAGNEEEYNIHFRTDELWFPWQSYRYTFRAESDWKTYRIPFSRLEKYKTFLNFDASEIKRIGLVAIGRKFTSDVCLASIGFYRD